MQQQFAALDRKVLLIKGVTEKEASFTDGNMTIVSYMTAYELNYILLKANVVVARSGYSTIMDLTRLKNKAILIPTPGQTEQEYLASELSAKGYIVQQAQDQLDIKAGLEQIEGLKDWDDSKEEDLLMKVMGGFFR